MHRPAPVVGLRLGHGRLDLGEVVRGRLERAEGGRRRADRVGALAGHDLLLVDDREPVIEAGQRATREPAVDHEGGTPPLAHGAGDVRGPRDHVAGREDAAGPCLQRLRVGVDGAVPVGRDKACEWARIGGHADGRHDDVAVQHVLAAGDGFGPTSAGRVRRAEGHLRAAQAAHGPAYVCDDVERGGQEGELHALPLRVVDLGPVGRHLLASAPVGDRDAGCAQAPRGPRRIHRHVAAAHDDDLACRPGPPLGRGGRRAGTRRHRRRPGLSSPGMPRLVDRGVPVATSTAS